jgi:hypothetical protein
MVGQRNREEAVNTQLAILISRYGVTADGETIHVHGKHRPDVLFQLRGLRVVIEGKFPDHPNAENVVLDDARKRVRSGIAHIAAAVVYSDELRSASTTKIISVLENTQLKYRIVAETHENENWFEGTPIELMGALRRAQEALTKDDIVESTAKSLSRQLETIARLWIGQQKICDRLSVILGIFSPKGETTEKADERRETAARVSALVLANAYIFQEQLALTDPRIETLRKIANSADMIGATAKHWRWIWENINYVPIFQLGERVLNELPESSNTTSAVMALLAEAQAICRQQAALRHDLMGRIYHWLLHEAKFLGTYYTSVSAATLLLKLAFSLDWKQDFSNPRELADFKVADLACGTGTLLMAAAQSLSDRYIRDRAAQDLSLSDKDISILHQTLMQNVLHGYDVLPTALHLTASTLALLAPDVAFRNMNLFVMPMGIDHGIVRLGSLDFLSGPEVKTQFSLDDTQLDTVRTGAAKSSYANAKVPPLQLCVMNPPFVRSVGGNLLFGSLPDERGRMQNELKSRVKLIGANATAGLGSVFVALADRRLEKGGRLAFVLPAALVSGEAWGPTRKLIADSYHLEMVIASHDAERPNFSENTDLSEILFIARKRVKEKAGQTLYVNLWRNPRSIHEALDLATRITDQSKPVDVAGVGFTSIPSPNGKLGEIVTAPAPVGEDNWAGALFAQTELFRTFWLLKTSVLRIPGQTKTYNLPLASLKSLGSLGYDRRDIHDAFEVSYEDWSPYPAFWGHKAEKVTSIAQKSTAQLIARTKAAAGRKLKDAEAVWSKAGSILLVERLRSNTHRLIATRFDEAVLGNTWWAFKGDNLTKDQEKALVLWLNSSLSILSFFGGRVVTEGAWMQMKKPGWLSMPVLDVRQLDKEQLMEIRQTYKEIGNESLAPVSQLDSDVTRIKIDNCIAKVLGIPDLKSIRALLAREPGLNAVEINPRKKRAVKGDDHEDEDE